MALDDFADFMTDTVLIEAYNNRDGYGTPSYLPQVPYACRVDGKSQVIVDEKGQERVSHAMVYILGNPLIGANDRIQLPAGFVPQQPKILAVNRFTDEHGPHHLEIML
jgi:hypothetical protein